LAVPREGKRRERNCLLNVVGGRPRKRGEKGKTFPFWASPSDFSTEKKEEALSCGGGGGKSEKKQKRGP